MSREFIHEPHIDRDVHRAGYEDDPLCSGRLAVFSPLKNIAPDLHHRGDGVRGESRISMRRSFDVGSRDWIPPHQLIRQT